MAANLPWAAEDLQITQMTRMMIYGIRKSLSEPRITQMTQMTRKT